MDQEKEKSEYQKIIDGDQEPVGSQKGWKNLEKRVSFNDMDPEKRREICRKGAAAVQQLHGKKKTAKQALADVLTLKVSDEIIKGADIDPAITEKLKRDNPDATMYDLIQAVAVGRALGGNVKAMEYVRDTHGDAPIKQIEVTENITTEADRELMRQLSERLQDADRIEVVKDIGPADDPIQ